MRKTKFIGTPTGQEGKRARQDLRRYGTKRLEEFLDRIAPGEYSKLNLKFGYMIPDRDRRGYLSAIVDKWSNLRFFISPGTEPGRYMSDKIEFVYSDQCGQFVILEITKEQKAKDLFGYLERSGTLRVEMQKTLEPAN